MKNNKILIIFFSLIFLIAIFTTKGFGLFQSKQVNPDAFMQIPLSEITNQAKWYEYNLNGEKIKFFAIKADDGSVKTAFNACDVCYASGKGYRQEGSDMVCNNCGLRFPINGLGTENKNPGGCWPKYLPNIVEGDYILIKENNLRGNN